MQVWDRITKLFSKVKESAFISSKYNVVSITALSKKVSDILFAQTSSTTQSDSQISTSTPKTPNDKKPLDSKESKFVEHVILRAPKASTIIMYTPMSSICYYIHSKHWDICPDRLFSNRARDQCHWRRRRK